jgi:hypothetical protein
VVVQAAQQVAQETLLQLLHLKEITAALVLSTQELHLFILAVAVAVQEQQAAQQMAHLE